MIRTTLAILLGSAVLAAGASGAKAQQYPWCAIVEVAGSMGENCGFESYEQCIATVRGQGGYCRRNERYRGPEDDRFESRHPEDRYPEDGR